MEKTFHFKSLAEFHSFCNLPQPEHPLISLIDYSKVSYPIEDSEFKWIQHYYSIGLKRNVNAKFNYGQQTYDFDAGLLTFISPLQHLKVEVNPTCSGTTHRLAVAYPPRFFVAFAFGKKNKII